MRADMMDKCGFIEVACLDLKNPITTLLSAPYPNGMLKLSEPCTQHSYTFSCF